VSLRSQGNRITEVGTLAEDAIPGCSIAGPNKRLSSRKLLSLQLKLQRLQVVSLVEMGFVTGTNKSMRCYGYMAKNRRPSVIGFLQHTPASRVAGGSLVDLDHTHKLVSELLEQRTLERFSHKISNHEASGTPLHIEFFSTDWIGHKEVSNIDVLCTLATRGFAILFKENSTLVILVQDVFGHFVALSL
jgi:hypothetical protein